jgi:scyllo-inositol 2-dehydrogenase (NAD+)
VTQVLTDKSSHVYAIAPDANDMYIAEMQHFLACVRGKETPRVTGVDGKRVLEIALAAKHSAQTRCEVAV